MQNCDNPQGLFVGRVGDQVFVNQKKPQGPLGEVRSFVALIGKRHSRGNGRQDFGDHSIGCVQVIGTNEFPNLVEINTASGWKAYRIMNLSVNGERRRSCRGSRLRLRRWGWASPRRFLGHHSGC
jgi:hypothetical protein